MSNCNRCDVARYGPKAQYHSDVEQKQLIKIVSVPDENFELPETERHFQFQLLKEFSIGECYSTIEEVAYCLPFILFGYKFEGKGSIVKNR